MSFIADPNTSISNNLPCSHCGKVQAWIDRLCVCRHKEYKKILEDLKDATIMEICDNNFHVRKNDKDFYYLLKPIFTHSLAFQRSDPKTFAKHRKISLENSILLNRQIDFVEDIKEISQSFLSSYSKVTGQDTYSSFFPKNSVTVQANYKEFLFMGQYCNKGPLPPGHQLPHTNRMCLKIYDKNLVDITELVTDLIYQQYEVDEDLGCIRLQELAYYVLPTLNSMMKKSPLMENVIRVGSATPGCGGQIYEDAKESFNKYKQTCPSN